MKKKAQKEPVRLREKKLSNGNLSLYLDYYDAGERQYEFLKLYLIDKPKTALEKQSNQATLELALRIKAKRTEAVLTDSFDLQSKNKGTANFVSYYQAYITTYTKKDHRVLSASFNKFKDYLQEAHGKERLAFKDLTQTLY